MWRKEEKKAPTTMNINIVPSFYDTQIQQHIDTQITNGKFECLLVFFLFCFKPTNWICLFYHVIFIFEFFLPAVLYRCRCKCLFFTTFILQNTNKYSQVNKPINYSFTDSITIYVAHVQQHRNSTYSNANACSMLVCNQFQMNFYWNL